MTTPTNLPRNLQHRNLLEKRKRTKKAQEKAPEALKPLSDKELESLDEDVKRKFHKDFTLRDFQSQAARAQLQRKNALVHASTGAGKTAIVAAPHAHPSAKGRITFLVSPLIALQDEQAETFRDEYNLSAIAINSSHGGLTTKNIADICAAKYQIVVISPEMMLTRRFTKNVIKNKKVANSIMSIVVDEAHVVSHWGSGFRKKYGELGILRTLLPDSIPFVALSATLPPRVRIDILSKLQFPKDYISINIGNDRPNVSLVVRAIQHPMNTYKDLDFVIPTTAKSAVDIPKTFVYSDDVPSGPDIVDHLEELLPKDLQGLGLVRPFSAAFSQTYRRAVMKQFKAGVIRVLVCTDAAGMGCNIPDVDVVVQWKLPGTLSMFIQRAGRAARARGRTGLAVLLVEKAAYALDCESVVENDKTSTTKTHQKKKKPAAKQTKRRERATGEYEKGVGKEFAKSRGVNRGTNAAKTDAHPRAGWEPVVNEQGKDEGLLAFVQTGCCRRRILTHVYANQEPNTTDSVDCCDICQPRLLHRTRPGLHKTHRAPALIKSDEPHRPTVKALYDWRTQTYKANHSGALWSPQALLSNELAILLASVGPLASFSDLKRVVGEQWGWWDQYSASLWETVRALDIPPVVKEKKKRSVVENEDETVGTSAPPPKRTRRTAVASSSDVGGREQEVSMPTPVHQHASQAQHVSHHTSNSELQLQPHGKSYANTHSVLTPSVNVHRSVGHTQPFQPTHFQVPPHHNSAATSAYHHPSPMPTTPQAFQNPYATPNSTFRQHARYTFPETPIQTPSPFPHARPQLPHPNRYFQADTSPWPHHPPHRQLPPARPHVPDQTHPFHSQSTNPYCQEDQFWGY